MTITTDLEAVCLSLHQRELIALVLREHADDMDKAYQQAKRSREAFAATQQWQVAGSLMTNELRELAHYVEWGDAV